MPVGRRGPAVLVLGVAREKSISTIPQLDEEGRPGALGR
jgi:hypothetical protein